MRLLAAFAVLVGATAFAEGFDVPPDDVECTDSATVAIANCMNEAYEKADKELNEVWKQVLTKIESSSDYMPAEEIQEWKAAMISAQKTWVSFKEQDCEGGVYFEWWGGTGAGGAIATCLYNHTSPAPRNSATVTPSTASVSLKRLPIAPPCGQGNRIRHYSPPRPLWERALFLSERSELRERG